MSKGSAPSPPDYTSAAVAQGDANIQAARVGAALNRTNQVTPYGSVNHYAPGTYPGSNPSANVAPGSPAGSPGGFGAHPYLPQPNQSTGSMGLASPSLPAMYGGSGGGVSNFPTGAGGYSGGAGYNPTSDQWTEVTALSPAQQALYNTNVGNQQGAASKAASILPNVQSSVPTANFQGINTSGVTPLPSNLDADRQNVQDSLYKEQSQYLDPQFKQSDQALQDQLVNEGLRPGDAAYDTAEKNAGLQKQQAYSNAQMNAITGATGQESQQIASALGVNSTQFGQAQAQASTANQNAQSLYGENLQNAELPVSDFASLYGIGSSTPGQNTPLAPGASAPAAPDLLGATNSQYQGSINSYNAGQAQNAQTDSSLESLAAIAAIYF